MPKELPMREFRSIEVRMEEAFISLIRRQTNTEEKSTAETALKGRI